LHVVEVVVSLGDPRRAPEVVERKCGEAALGEAQRELLVEAIEAPDVREDHDPDRSRLVRGREEGGEPVSVGGHEHEVVVRDGGARNRRNRGLGVELEAHGGELTAGGRSAAP